MTTRRGHGRPARLRTALAVVCAAVLAGCVGIPTSGPIGDGEVVVNEPGAAFPLASDPTPDAEPEQIVAEFIGAAAAGLYDEFTSARKFLTVTASEGWDPRAQVRVYQDGEPAIAQRDDGTVLVTVPVSAMVDAAGRYSEAVPDSSPTELAFELRKDTSSQWRISALEDGVLMGAASFGNLYRRTPVYFATSDRAHLVPDLRWLPERSIATSAVAELLAGPSPWLRDGVVTGAPEGSDLSTSSVPVNNGVASVDLSAAVRLAESPDRGLLQAQLEAVLQRLPGIRVTDVDVSVGGLPWEAIDVPELVRDAAPQSGPYMIIEDESGAERLAVIDGGDVTPLDDAAPLTGLDARDPAVSLDEEIRVVLDGPDRLVLLPTDGSAPVELHEGDDLVAPSVDRFGWVWTGGRDATGALTAVDPTGEAVPVAAEWLDEREVRSLRVSRDGSRIAVVSVGSEPRDVTVQVASITRDDGVPQTVSSEPLRVGAVLTDATEVAWIDEGSLAVLGTSGALSVPTMHIVPVGGPTQPLSLVDDAVGLAAGRGNGSLYVTVSGGALYWRQDSSWVEVAADVRDPVFPG